MIIGVREHKIHCRCHEVQNSSAENYPAKSSALNKKPTAMK